MGIFGAVLTGRDVSGGDCTSRRYTLRRWHAPPYSSARKRKGHFRMNRGMQEGRFWIRGEYGISFVCSVVRSMVLRYGTSCAWTDYSRGEMRRIGLLRRKRKRLRSSSNTSTRNRSKWSIVFHTENQYQYFSHEVSVVPEISHKCLFCSPQPVKAPGDNPHGT